MFLLEIGFHWIVLNNKNLMVNVDIGPTVGYGHLRRMISLCDHLQDSFKFKIWINLLSIGDYDYLVPDDYKQPVEKLSLVLFDSHRSVDKQISNFKKRNIPTIAFDYFSYKQSADLTISIYEHFLPVPEGKRVSGLRYFMLRPDVKTYHDKTEKKGYALIVLGGADVNNLSFEIASHILSQGFKVKLVCGPLVSKGTLPYGVEAYHNPSNFLELMSNCSFAITNGGSTMLELLYLNKKVWVIPQSPYEERFSEYLYEKGYLIGKGDISYEKLNKGLSTEIIKIHSIDSGVENVCSEILNYV